ncbi:hypothetical protein IWZ01DRAFT_194730 [Phyllosticta capitalensis]
MDDLPPDKKASSFSQASNQAPGSSNASANDRKVCSDDGLFFGALDLLRPHGWHQCWRPPLQSSFPPTAPYRPRTILRSAGRHQRTTLSVPIGHAADQLSPAQALVLPNLHRTHRNRKPLTLCVDDMQQADHMHNDFVLNPNPDVAFYRAARGRVVDFFPSGLTSSRSAVVLTAEASILDASTLLRFADFVSCTQDRPEKVWSSVRCVPSFGDPF